MITANEFSKKLYDKAQENGANPALLLDRHAQALLDLSINSVSALSGDARIQKHLEAQFKLGKFSLLADSFVESRLWLEALLDVLKEIAEAALSTVVQAAANGLANALKEGIK